MPVASECSALGTYACGGVVSSMVSTVGINVGIYILYISYIYLIYILYISYIYKRPSLYKTVR
jgi:hypothetical protein